MEDDRQSSGEKSLHELEFNNLNIHLSLTLNYGTASEQLNFDFMVLYNVLVLSWGLTITQDSIAQYRIWIGLISPIPDPQKWTVSEPIPIPNTNNSLALQPKRYHFWITKNVIKNSPMFLRTLSR